MKQISKQDIDTLLQLQKAESQIVKLEASLAADGNREAKLQQRQDEFEQGLERQRKDLEVCNASCKEIEQEIALIDQRIAKSNETLRMVRSNKEYQVLLREVEDNRRRKEGIETSLLELLDEKEALAKSIAETEQEFLQLKTQLDAEKKELASQLAENKALLEKYREEQKQIGDHLAPSLMALFKRIAKMNRGFAVANVEDAICMGCFMNVPPQLYIEVQRAKELICCPQCSRILYYEQASGEE